MKIFFMASPRSLSTFGENIKNIHKTLEVLGHTHVSDYLIKSITSKKYELPDVETFFEESIHDLKKADVCVFEASTPSMAIGYLVGQAIQYGKAVICLYTGEYIPEFLNGIRDERTIVTKYSLDNLQEQVKYALSFAQNNIDTRFNFFVSPSIMTYLDWISKNKNIPRSVFLRSLIERDMAANKEYNK